MVGYLFLYVNCCGSVIIPIVGQSFAFGRRFEFALTTQYTLRIEVLFGWRSSSTRTQIRVQNWYPFARLQRLVLVYREKDHHTYRSR